jgi:hypothetical protein
MNATGPPARHYECEAPHTSETNFSVWPPSCNSSCLGHRLRRRQFSHRKCCVSIPSRPDSSRLVFRLEPSHRPPAGSGCTRSSTTASGSSPARMRVVCGCIAVLTTTSPTAFHLIVEALAAAPAHCARRRRVKKIGPGDMGHRYRGSSWATDSNGRLQEERNAKISRLQAVGRPVRAARHCVL